jgi:hypothetical protein
MAMTMNGIEMNAESVMGLFSFMDPTQNKRRVFTSEDLVRESEKVRNQARVQYTQNRETDMVNDDHRNVDDRRFGRGNTVSSTASHDPMSLRAHNFAPVFLR